MVETIDFVGCLKGPILKVDVATDTDDLLTQVDQACCTGDLVTQVDKVCCTNDLILQADQVCVTSGLISTKTIPIPGPSTN